MSSTFPCWSTARHRSRVLPDLEEHLVEMLFIPWARPSATQVVGVGLPELDPVVLEGSPSQHDADYDGECEAGHGSSGPTCPAHARPQQLQRPLQPRWHLFTSQMRMPLAGRSRVDESRCHSSYSGHFSLVGTYSRLRCGCPSGTLAGG
jgi:hypothetical protein